ncbi:MULTISPECIES: hypothetical protein [Serratia]|uniref:hypothetical protein n=1 Tax=Serratia TaxID=613 RepID=UPI0011AF1E6D|nr:MULTISPECIES: hypothetical protein [Serratia]CAI0965786.1 Uncharacterised protein [Serratia quinivorans]CAI1715926.1 Uncharacterised protein [Serratia quinivorans]
MELVDIAKVVLVSILPIAGAAATSVIIFAIVTVTTSIHYKRTISIALQKNKLKNEDLHTFLNKKNITYRSLDHILKQLFEDSLKTSKSEHDISEKLREIIHWFEEQEGLLELPKDVRTNLEVIQKQTPETKYQINRLASSLKELYRTHAQREARLRWFSYISGGIGIFGVFYGIFQSF